MGALLRKRGIDLDNNRFLILQGEVEQIAMMPPKAKTEHDEGLLEFLEDIIGSNRHLEGKDALAIKFRLLWFPCARGQRRLCLCVCVRTALLERSTDLKGNARTESELRKSALRNVFPTGGA